MIISRRPNRRASSENAPGPSRTTDATIITTKTSDSLLSKTFGVGAGNQESVKPTPLNPTRRPATGVRNPTRSEALLATASKPIAHAANLGLCRSAR